MESLDANGPPLSRRVMIVNDKGLHARAAARFVATAERFAADIRVGRGDVSVGGRSIMGLLLLAAAKGTHIDLAASGMDASDALHALEALVASGFGENGDQPTE